MSVCAKFQLPSLSISGLKVFGGVVWCSVVGLGGVWLRPILMFSLSLSQAKQNGPFWSETARRTAFLANNYLFLYANKKTYAGRLLILMF